MNVLIIEDEIRIAKYIRNLLTEELGEYQPHFILAPSLEEGQALISSNETLDVVFLDLNLNGKDGFEILKAITSEDLDVVICSAYHEKAITAFEYGVLDFIPKPITRERLKKTINRYLNREQNKQTPRYITIKTNKGIERIHTTDIVYFKGSDQYSEIRLIQNRTKIHQKSLDRLEKLFNPAFLRVHRSYLVKKDTIAKMERVSSSDYRIVLHNGEKIPVGRQKVKEVKKLFSQTNTDL